MLCTADSPLTRTRATSNASEERPLSKGFHQRKESSVFLCHLVRGLSFIGQLSCSVYTDALRIGQGKAAGSICDCRVKPGTHLYLRPLRRLSPPAGRAQRRQPPCLLSPEKCAALGNFRSSPTTGAKRRQKPSWAQGPWTPESPGPGLQHHLCHKTLAQCLNFLSDVQT